MVEEQLKFSKYVSGVISTNQVSQMSYFVEIYLEEVPIYPLDKENIGVPLFRSS